MTVLLHAALANSQKSKGAPGALLKIRAPDLSNPSKPTEKELIRCKELEDSDAAKQRSCGLCRDKGRGKTPKSSLLHDETACYCLFSALLL